GPGRRQRYLEERRRAGVALHLVDAADQVLELVGARQQVRGVGRGEGEPEAVALSQGGERREDLDIEAGDRARWDRLHGRARVGVVRDERAPVAGEPAVGLVQLA